MTESSLYFDLWGEVLTSLSPSFYSETEAIHIRQSKFNISNDKAKRSYNGIVFDSILEMKYYRDVILPQVGSGEIVKYDLQKSYELQPKFTHGGKTVRPITYVADFYLEFKDGHTEVIDTKGMPDTTAKLKRKLFWYRYPDTDYRWICYSGIDGGWCDYEFVSQRRKERKKSKSK